MKRPVAWGLMLALTLMAGCAAKDEAAIEAQPAAEGNAAYLAVDVDGSIARVRKAGVLRVGADPKSGLPFWAPPHEGKGPLQGFEAELAEEVARLFGVKAQPVPMSWSALLEDLKQGKVDLVINGLEAPSSDAQAKMPELAFSKPYMGGGYWIVVPADDKTTERIADLKDKEVAVMAGDVAKSLFEAASKQQKLAVKVAEFDQVEDLFQKLETKAVSAAMLPQPLASLFLVQHPGFRMVGEPIMPRGYVMALRREDKALLNTIDAWLGKSSTDKAYQQVAKKWKMLPGV